ncbi:MFS transporter [Cryptosporangium minutisporangium]|uniref:MFS transporter n=2 Tax=Cryptosporangium minutisporangium TaxID=113569 RepID=A0ABP6SV24_9ACTN
MPSIDRPEGEAARLGRAFGQFWLSYTVSATGSALNAGALALIAIVVLHAGPLQVSLLAVIGSLASAILSLPLGVVIERSEKRAVLVLTDLVQFGVLLTVPLAAVTGRLTYPHLCVVAAVGTTCSIVSVAAGLAYVKAAVREDARVAANARLDSVNWTTYAIGPPAGGALIGLTGPTVTMVVDGVSFLFSALLLWRVPRAPALAQDTTSEGVRADLKRELWAGWRLILSHRGLRGLYFNGLVFGGSYLWTVPLVAVLVLTDLGAMAWQYGLVLGIPSLGGLLGAMLSVRLTALLGERRCLLLFGAGRTMWLLPLPFLGDGAGALIVLGVSQFLLLVAAGVFNPVFTTYRMRVTPDALMARVGTAWAVSSRAVQPVFIAVGGALAGWSSPRWSLAAAALMCLLSAGLLPWRSERAARRQRATI